MSEFLEGLSRRNFLTGTGVAVAGAAMAAGLSGCGTPTVANVGGESSSEGSGLGNAGDGVMAWLGEEPEIDDANVEEEVDCDVAIIGLSDSGCCAYRSAAEAGAKVIGIEKSESINSCGSDAAIIGGSVQAKWGREGIDHDMIIDAHVEECCHQVKRTIMKRYVDEVGDMFDWFLEASDDVYIADNYIDEIPDEYADNYIVPSYYPLPGNYDYTKEAMPCYPTTVNMSNLKALLQSQVDAAEATGNASAYFGYFAEKLIMEDGACVGLYARNAQTGGYLKVNAGSVILCTGDYSSNSDMVAYYAPETVENEIVTVWQNTDIEGNNTNTGDGHKLGTWAGARMQQNHAPMIHNMGGGADIQGKGVIGINGYLQLDLNGKRFMNEDVPGQQLENQIERQKGGVSVQIWDAKWPEQCESFPAAHGCSCYYMDELPVNNTAIAMSARTPQNIQDAIDDGRAFTADTLEELLANFEGLDVETAIASIEHYNELCAEGEDTDFGKVSSRLFPVENAPYYACLIEKAIMLVCIGGLESDEDCHTFDADRNVIPGLYVAGNVQGDRFAVTYPISLKGCSVGMALFFGYIAGQNAAAGV